MCQKDHEGVHRSTTPVFSVFHIPGRTSVLQLGAGNKEGSSRFSANLAYSFTVAKAAGAAGETLLLMLLLGLTPSWEQ
jgi:hypothetical protein